MTEQMINIVINWFASAPLTALMLPDGWFGKPGDFRYSLTYFISRPHKTILELNNRILLTFTDIASAEIIRDNASEEKKLILTGYLQMVFQWQNSEPDRLLPEFRADSSLFVQIYRAGSVTFFAP